MSIFDDTQKAQQTEEGEEKPVRFVQSNSSPKRLELGEDTEEARLSVADSFAALYRELEANRSLVSRLYDTLDPVLQPAKDYDINTGHPPYTTQMSGSIHGAALQAMVTNVQLEKLIERIDL